MDDTEKILLKFKRNRKTTFTPKDLSEESKCDISKVRTIVAKLLKQGKIERLSRGNYRYLEPPKLKLDSKVKRYLTTLEKTCIIAIHELMLTEPLVGSNDQVEIEHQIAYFARHLVKARWEMEHSKKNELDVDEKVFRRAKKIHEWSKMVFEKNLSKKRK